MSRIRKNIWQHYRKELIGSAIGCVILLVLLLVVKVQLNALKSSEQPVSTVPNVSAIDLNKRHYVVVPHLADELFPLWQDPSLQVPSEEDMPWYYGDTQAHDSVVYQEQYVTDVDESVGLYRMDNDFVLRQEDERYNGWLATHYGTLLQVDNGNIVHSISDYPYTEMIAFQSVTRGEVPNTALQTQKVDYAIWYQNPHQDIWSMPDGITGAVRIGKTEAYENFPMEVQEEATVNGKHWIHVYNGYHEIGWLVQDMTQQDYILTDYSEKEMLDTIAEVIAEELSVIGGPAGASFVNHRTFAQVDVDNQVFMPASTQKIYVFAELYHQYKEGNLTPDTIVTMTYDDIAGGAGIISGNGEGSQYSLDELVNLVAIYSDNTAANMLIEAVGGGAVITPHVHEWGMLDTYVDGKYYHDRNGLFQTTPHDAAMLFAKLARRELNGEPWDSMMIDKLRMNTHTFLRNYIYGEDSWNKSGLGEPEQNDVATFVTPYGSYSIAVYTSSWINHDNRYDEVGRLSARVYEVYNDYQARLPY